MDKSAKLYTNGLSSFSGVQEWHKSAIPYCKLGRQRQKGHTVAENKKDPVLD